jgi:hypothetical protein
MYACIGRLVPRKISADMAGTEWQCVFLLALVRSGVRIELNVHFANTNTYNTRYRCDTQTSHTSCK